MKLTAAPVQDPAPSPRRSPSPRLASPVRPAETTEPAAKAAKTLPAKPKAKAKATPEEWGRGLGGKDVDFSWDFPRGFPRIFRDFPRIFRRFYKDLQML